MPYKVGYATSNKAKCKSSKLCGGAKITKGSLQFGNVVDFDGGSRVVGKHWGCVTSTTLKNLKSKFSDISELDGYQDLNDEDKARVDAAFRDGHVADADIPNSAKKSAADGNQDDDEGAEKGEQKVLPQKKADDMNADDCDVDPPERNAVAAPRKTAERKQKAELRADDEEPGERTEFPSDLKDDITFKGRTSGGISCEQFVRAVRKHSIAENKARDNEYIADYVMSCLDGEALHWSETLSVEIQGDWTLLRRALLAEYGTSSYSPAISNVLNPTLNAASATPFPNATASVPSIAGVAQAFSQDGAIPVVDRGRIRMTVGAVSYYVEIVGYRSLGMCVATQDINKAATLEAIDVDSSIELRFVTPGSTKVNWLGMVWDSKSIEIRSHAALIPTTIKGSSTAVAEKNSSRYWVGEVSVVKWTRSVEDFLSPRFDVNEGIRAVVIRINRAGGDSYLYISNDLKTFPLHNSYKMKEVQLVFEPL